MTTRVAVILAGGVGVRLGLALPKQLITIAGRTILEHTVARFERHPMVDQIIIMMAPGYVDQVRQIVQRAGFTKVVSIREGADTRNGTTLRALEEVGPDHTHVLFHDAVRPLVTDRIITECFLALDHYAAVDVAIPSADTIIEVEDGQTIRDIPPRHLLRRGQTPQAFHAGVLRSAYREAAADGGFEATDDCAVVLRYRPDVPIHVVAGEEQNVKVTNPIDVYIADRLFQLSTETIRSDRSEDDYRAALQDRVLVVLGGSSGIGADVAKQAAAFGAVVRSFSRSETGTHIERRSDLRKVAESVVEECGGVDFVVNAAAVLPRGDLVDADDETISAATQINYVAPMLIAQEFFPLLRERRGSLLNYTSSSYTRGRSGYALYSSAKAAIVNLTQALSDEWAGVGVRVNCINPERTGTPMRTKAFGVEEPGTLLSSAEVARRSIDVLISGQTGMIVDVRRDDPLPGSTAQL